MSVTGSTDLPPCEVPSWLSVSPTAGSVAPGGQQTVQVSFDSTGLSVGDVLEANLCIESNDPRSPWSWSGHAGGRGRHGAR